MHFLCAAPWRRLHFLSAAARWPVVVWERGTPAPDGGGAGGVAQSAIPGLNSSAPTSRIGLSGQAPSPSIARGSPSRSAAPPGGAAGLPWSMNAWSTAGLRWKSLVGAFGTTKLGTASVWKVWQEFPVVVGPAEKVIVQLVGTFGFWAIDEVTMLESRVRGVVMS